MARLAGQLRDAAMVAEAEALLRQPYAAVETVKVRPGLLQCLWHCNALKLGDSC